jgi:eukaryotic-like serine/threonine-protein kinase
MERASTSTDDIPIRKGQILGGKYRVDELLGSGGMSFVFAATHVDLDVRVAIKVLRWSALQHETTVKRFARESRTAVKIKGEHVVRVLDVGKLEIGLPYLVMELFEGGIDLGTYASKRMLRIDEVVDFTLQALRGIAEAHAMGIVHRDIKPANLFVTKRRDGSSCIKVLDFGISKSIRSDAPAALTRASAIVGSPRFMAPEQWLAKDIDVRADIWAIGAVMYRLLAGRAPFAGETIPQVCAAVLETEPVSLSELRRDVPVELERVILCCLSKDRAGRYRDVGEVARALAPFAPPGREALVQSIAATIGSRQEVCGRFSEKSTSSSSKRHHGMQRFVAGVVALAAFTLSIAMIIDGWPPPMPRASQVMSFGQAAGRADILRADPGQRH